MSLKAGCMVPEAPEAHASVHCPSSTVGYLVRGSSFLFLFFFFSFAFVCVCWVFVWLFSLVWFVGFRLVCLVVWLFFPWHSKTVLSFLEHL